MTPAAGIFLALVAIAIASPFVLDYMFDGDLWKRMREPGFPCAECEHVVVGDKCAACLDRVTGELLWC